MPFNPKKEYLFCAFGAAERCEAIEEFLEKQIDFDYLNQNQVIDDHFHLHKATVVEDIQDSYDAYTWRLTTRMMWFGNSFTRYLQPLNMTVEYFGEKVAFEYAFLIHYNAWLIIASVGGIVLFVVQLLYSLNNEVSLLESDTTYNGLYSIFICIWATLFIESWKQK